MTRYDNVLADLVPGPKSVLLFTIQNTSPDFAQELPRTPKLLQRAPLRALRGRSSLRCACRRGEVAARLGGEKGLPRDRVAGETEVLRERALPVRERGPAPRVRGPL